jgi:hypothetical protein
MKHRLPLMSLLLFVVPHIAAANAWKRECAMSPGCPEALADSKAVCEGKGGSVIGIMGPCTQWPDGRFQQCVTCQFTQSSGCSPERREADARFKEITRLVNEDQSFFQSRGFQMVRLEPGETVPVELAQKLTRLLVDKAVASAGAGRPGKKKGPDQGALNEIEKLKTRLGATPLGEWAQTPKIDEGLAKVLTRAAKQADPGPVATALADALGGADLGIEKLRAIASVFQKALARAGGTDPAWSEPALEAALAAWDTGFELPLDRFPGWSSSELSDIRTRAERLKQQLLAFGPARAALAELPPCR